MKIKRLKENGKVKDKDEKILLDIIDSFRYFYLYNGVSPYFIYVFLFIKT